MAEEKNTRSIAKLFWGRTIGLPLYFRVGGLVFIATTIAPMSFCQLGFLSMGGIDGNPIYLILLLAPIIMGAFAFGPITGGLLGLLGGFIAFAHATYLPLDFLESTYFGIPLNTIGVFTSVAVLAGILFNLALRNNPQGGKRVMLIVVICVFVSLLTSTLLHVNMVVLIGGFELYTLAQYYMGLSVVCSTVQAAVDSVLIALLCLVADLVIRKAQERGANRKLFPVFLNYLVLVSAIVFMTASAIIFSNTTIQERDRALEDMNNELTFLQDQLTMQPGINAQLLVGDYDKATNGAAAITSKQGVIVASNDGEKFKVGTSAFTAMGMPEYLGDIDAIESLLEYYSSGREPIVVIPDTDDDFMPTVDAAFLGIRKIADGYVALHRSSDMIYAGRADTMTTSASLALILVVATALLASILVRQLIVRRIDEANTSLAKITAGDLDERVPEQSTVEFTSLANGINSTVESLSDMIDEVARRNEQDLATAKTIQESSLPTEFPAFPDIDTFDIYASMKTAKEVGGDFYDFFTIEDTTRIGFVMADVSGKGIPAALFMMAARSQLRNYMEAGLPLNEAVDAANHQLCIGNDAGMFVTCWVAELDYKTGELTYVNGGHNPPMLLHDNTWSWLTEVSGMPLGLFDGIPYRPHTLQLAPGDTIYTYTDGVTEAMNTEDKLYGEDRLEAVLNQNRGKDPRSIDVAVRSSLADYTVGAEQSDDITMLVLKYGVPPMPKAASAIPTDTTRSADAGNDTGFSKEK